MGRHALRKRSFLGMFSVLIVLFFGRSARKKEHVPISLLIELDRVIRPIIFPRDHMDHACTLQVVLKDQKIAKGQ